MIEEGLVLLVNQDAAVQTALNGNTGGFLAVLPKGQPLPSWSYRWIAETNSYTLHREIGLTKARVEVTCYGNDGKQAVRLAKAVTTVLDAYTGVLPDPGATRVQLIESIGKFDDFDDAPRTIRRVVEFYVWY